MDGHLVTLLKAVVDPPPIFSRNWCPKGRKKFFGDPTPPSLALPLTPLSQGLQTKISREETDICMENLKQATGEIRHRCAPQDL